MTNTATTLVMGRSRGRNSSLKNQMGSVRSCPDVKIGDDDLVERQREGEHAAREQRRAHLRQQHGPERLPAVGAEIHRGFDPARRNAAQARDHVVVDDDDAERRVTRDDGPEPGIETGQLDRRQQRDAGDDPGQRDRQHEQQRRACSSREAGARQGQRSKRAEHQRNQRCDTRDS